jgi:rhodanese-related sulfurtransferase
MTRKGILILAAIFLGALLLISFGSRGYEEIEALQSIEKASAKIRKDFPDVKPIAPELLKSLLLTPGTLLLVDTREPEEFALSHLPGAVNLTTGKGILDHLKEMPAAPDAVIVYCSTGFRSAKLADSIRRECAVENLEGGIFLWANEGGSLVTESGEATALVHPYNRFYGRLLDQEHRAPSPDSP